MKFLFASDSFKGSISSVEAGVMLTQAAKEIFDDVECVLLPIADGGEGTMQALIKSVGGEFIHKVITGPAHKSVSANYGKIDNTKAIIEMATASGLPLVSESERNPLYTTTYGTGELIKDALDKGFSEIYIAIGGSATNDGGIGCLTALGVKFLDEHNNVLQGRGCDLERISRIDTSEIDPRIATTKFVVMCDVNNPLCGKNGATYTFSAQKGATPEIQDQLELGMINYRDIIKKEYGLDLDEIEGSGAAGGLGAALLVFLKAELQSGIEAILEITHFDDLIKDVDLVITGEGRTDGQSSHGKVLYGIGRRCKKYGVPAIALVGGIGDGAEEIFNHGICSIFTTTPAPISLNLALKNASDNYLNAARRLFRMLKVGLLMNSNK